MNDVERAENEQRAVNQAIIRVSREIQGLYRLIDLEKGMNLPGPTGSSTYNRWPAEGQST